MQFDRRAGEFGQDQHAVAIHPRRNELLADKVHPVDQRGDPGDVGGKIVFDQIVERDGARDQSDGLPFQRSEPAVDAACGFLDAGLDRGIGRHAAVGADRDMHQLDLAAQVRVVGQHPLEAFKLLHPALGIIGAPHRQQQLAPGLRLADPLGIGLHLGIRGAFGDEVEIHPDSGSADRDLPSFIGQHGRRAALAERGAVRYPFRPQRGPLDGFDIEKAARDRNEIGRVTGNVKADDIAFQQAGDDFAPPRQDVEHVSPGKGRVMKEGNLHVRAQLAQIPRHQPQVVVVDPDPRPLRRLARCRLGKGPVDLAKGRPVHRVVVELFLEAVKDRPERLFRRNVVEARHLFEGQRQSRHVVGAIGIGNLDDPLELGIGRILGQFPGDPRGLFRGREKALERRDDSVRAAVLAQRDLAIDLDLFIGLPVVDDDQIRRHRTGSPRFWGAG